MRPMTKTLMYLTLFLSLCTLFMRAQAQEAPQNMDELKAAVEKLRTESGITALGISLITPEGEIWTETFGDANTAKGVKANNGTLFRIGSTSKMFVGLAALKLAEEGKLDFNAKLSDLAPNLQFENQWEEQHPVRIVHLLEHTTGWDDMRIKEYAHSDPNPIELKQALSLYPESRSSRWIPGTRSAYCNTGPAVVALVIENITGQKFEDYIQENFFDPIGMSSATYFQPKDYENKAAHAYMNGKLIDFWHIIYRPAGSISANIGDMTKFLQFMLNRGELNGERLLPASAIDRMELPLSNLGAEQGITAGYGIYNYSSGFGAHGYNFQGHNGAVFGAQSDFSYNTELGAGFVILTTGTGGPYQIGELLKGYILKDQTPKTYQAIPLPKAFSELNGFYSPINPRNEMSRLQISLFGAMSISVDDEGFHRSPLFGGWKSTDVPIADNLLINTWTGTPSIAIVDDPLAGEALQIEGVLLQPVSSAGVYTRLVFVAYLSLLSIASLIYGMVWGNKRILKKLPSGAETQIRLWPTISSILLIGSLLLSMMAGMSIEALGTISILSVSMYLLSWGYALASGWSVITLFIYRNADMNKIVYWLAAMLGIMHLLANVYLASYGYVGIKTWA